MDIEEYKRIKKRRQEQFEKKDENDKQKYITRLISRILISIIVFFGLIIFSNSTEVGEKFIKDKVLQENISFTKIKNLYNKYLGNIVPFENIIKDDTTVFNEKITYEEINNYKDGYELKVKKNYLVPIINSGIVVFIGEKEGYGNTIIVQGIDEVDYWYGNVDNTTVSLYDYVNKGTYLGTSVGEKLYLSFKKGNEYLDYDEVTK